MTDPIVALYDRVTRLEGEVARLAKWGTIASVDKPAGMVTVTHRGITGSVGPMRWVALSSVVWAPPAVGEQCIVIDPGGESQGTVSLMVALVGISSGSGKGDKYVIGEGVTGKVAMADLVSQELQLIATALTGVSSGGGALTGPNSYTTPGSIASSKTEVE